MPTCFTISYPRAGDNSSVQHAESCTPEHNPGRGTTTFGEDKFKELGGAETYSVSYFREEKMHKAGNMANAGRSECKALGPYTQLENTSVLALTKNTGG